MKRITLTLFLALSVSLVFGQVRLSDLVNKSSVTGTEKIPVSGAGRPSITPNLLRSHIVHDSVSNGVTSIAPSQNAVYDALALKADVASVGFQAHTVTDYYVNGASGNDSNGGLSSGAGAWATIQKAMNVLASKVVNNNITVHIAAGTYAETVTAPPMLLTGNYRVTIEGTVTVDASGTSESGGQYAAGPVFSQLTDTDKAFSVNEHQTKILHITGGAAYQAADPPLNYYVIVANTATRIDIAGKFNGGSPAANTTYEILTPTSIIDGGTACILNYADRLTYKTISLTSAGGTGFGSFLNTGVIVYGSKIVTGADLGVGNIQSGLRLFGCYVDGTGGSAAVAWEEAFSVGDYAEDFLNSSANVNTQTGIKGCWIRNGTVGFQCSNSHTRLTENYFSDQTSATAIEIQRMGNVSMYGNNLSGKDLTVDDQSFAKIQSGNIIDDVIVRNSNIQKTNVGGYFVAVVATITTDLRSDVTGSGFTATTESYYHILQRARLRKNGTQSINNTTVTKVTGWNTTDWNVGITVTSDEFVAPITSVYHIKGCIVFASNNTGDRRAAYIRIGSTIYNVDQKAVVQNNQTVLNVETYILMTAGQAVQLACYQDSGGALNIDFAANWAGTFEIVRQP